MWSIAMFWAGYNDNNDEGSFANELNGQILRKENGFWPWIPAEPNGETLENCASVLAATWQNPAGWTDYICYEELRGFCKIQPRPRLSLRGLLLMVNASCVKHCQFFQG